MKSIEKLMLSRMKKGQVIGTTTATVIGIMVLIFMVFAVLYGISTLNPSGFFTTGSGERNATIDLQSNLTRGVSDFGAQIPTVFKVLAVVLAISAIVILIIYVQRMRGGGEGAPSL